MSVDDAVTLKAPQKRKRRQQDVKVVRRKGQRRQYISQHFTIAKKNSRTESEKSLTHDDVRTRTSSPHDKDIVASDRTIVAPTPVIDCPRIFFGLRVDELSSDSELSDVPKELGPDPFFSDDDALPPSVLRGLTTRRPRGRKSAGQSPIEKKSRSTSVKRSPAKSPYFPSVRHAHRPQFLATLPFPPLAHERFGLMQERLAHDPYRLLLATIFLNKTPGIRAMPIFYNLMKQYPSPQALSEADVADVTEIIRELGFQNQRARKCVELAKLWVRAPPMMGKRYRKLHYPSKGDGRDVKEAEVIDDSDSRVAWEISHLPGLGPYSHDSWRMFCRDELRNKAKDWLGAGARDIEFEPEWKRVLPADKELRAWMTWMWLKEGWIWNKETGEKTKADDELMRLANGGGIVQESAGQEHLIIQGVQGQVAPAEVRVEHPAGAFMPKS